MASRLLALPNELQRLIVSRVPHPADLRALCLVSKHVSDIATQYLYRDLVLPYSDTDKDWIDLRYLLESRGLQHVRTLTIPSPRNFNTDGFCKPLEQLLPKLPLKSLTNFRYSLYGRPTDEGLRYLLHHQEKLTNLQLDLSLAPTLEMLIREEETAIRSLKCLTALCLRFGYGENTSAEKYSELLDMINVTGLQSVILVANGGLGSFGREDLMEQFLKKALPTTLNYLNLSKICLPKSNEQCLHLDKYLSLRHLKLYKCSNAAFTLDSFCQPMLTSFDVVCGSRTSCQEDLAATSSFLRRFRSLDHLEIGNRIVVSEDWVIEDLTMSIANHAASLRSLVIFIHCIPSMSLTGTPLRCEKLCQFVMTEEGTDLVGQCLDVVLGLPRLVTLYIITLDQDKVPDGSDRNCNSRMHQYAFIAETLFNRIPQNVSLSLLAFGGWNRSGELPIQSSNSEDYSRWCFFRHHITDPRIIGITRAIPIQIPIDQAKYIASESDVLERKKSVSASILRMVHRERLKATPR